MKKSLLLGICLSLVLPACTTSAPKETAAWFESGEESEIFFSAGNSEPVEAYAGSFTVEEHRGEEGTQSIAVRYVRFPATTDNPGAPIVYLSGGPGGSGIGTARGPRFPLFMAMRAYGDVIALDQRGTGQSDAPPACTSSVVVPTTRPVGDTEYRTLTQEAAEEGWAIWADEGHDMLGYTTSASVGDLDALRRHLGADKITLWGISYGSHLALAAMNDMPDQIDRVILSSIEGLDHTVKLPSRTDDQIRALGAYLGDDLEGLMRRVHAKLDAEPVTLQLPQPDGTTVPYVLQRLEMQQLASALIADPARAGMMHQLYSAADAGVYEPIAGLLARFVTPGEPITFQAMPLAMDRASGISPARLRQVEREAETSILGDYLNYPMPHIAGLFPEIDLGPEFRKDPVSDIPALILTGSLDGRTYPESQTEAVSGLSNAVQVIVEGAGHNLFMSSPEVQEVMETFMRGETVETRLIETNP